MDFKGLGPAIFFSTLIISGLLMYKKNSSARKSAEEMERFLATESKANTTRRKDISSLDYIRIPMDTLPFVDTDIYDIKDYQKQLKDLSQRKILNLSGISNTDLKLEYGAPNLPLLSEYDENCMRLFKVIANLGYHLSKNDFHKEAVAFLEYGISIGTDISRNYYVLADEYLADNNINAVEALIEKAKEISTVMGGVIVKELTNKLEDKNSY